MSKNVLGIDENGFGPVMGPLIVTGILLRLEEEPKEWFSGISDSKSFFPARNVKNLRKLEEIAIATYYIQEQRLPKSRHELLSNFCGELECFSGNNICLSGIPKDFIWNDILTVHKKCEEFALWAQQNKIVLQRVNAQVICVRQFNRFINEGNSKLLLDFLSFCKVIEDCCKYSNTEIFAGKLGGMKFYSKYLHSVYSQSSVSTVEETEGSSIYYLKDNNKIRLGFYRDVERLSFAAALASIVGKYLRELFMENIIKNLGITEPISGYRDIKTKKEIESLNFEELPRDCILRIK